MTTELRQQLDEQLYFLDSSLTRFSANQVSNKLDNKVLGQSITFDISSEIEAKRIATCVRVLVHDTNNSHSLLGQLNEKFKMKFLDSSSPNDGRLHSMTGMTGVRGTKKNQYFGLIGKINELGTLNAVPLYRQHLPDWYSSYGEVQFQEWWDKVVICIEGHELTRKDLVLTITNKDGGAHVDTIRPENYTVAKTTSLSLNINDTETDFLRNVVYASVAQIGWELLNSI